MEYTDYFLKFETKAEAIEIFSQIPDHFSIENDNLISQTDNFAIDEVGIISDVDENLNVVQLEGYHFNYRIVYGNRQEPPLPDLLQPYVVNPSQPRRVFF